MIARLCLFSILTIHTTPAMAKECSFRDFFRKLIPSSASKKTAEVPSFQKLDESIYGEETILYGDSSFMSDNISPHLQRLYFNLNPDLYHKQAILTQKSVMRPTVQSRLFADKNVSILPEHQQILDRYYSSLREDRHFDESRVKLLQEADKSLEPELTEIYRFYNQRTNETYGSIRLFYGVGDYLLPYERSLKGRGLQSAIIPQLRKNKNINDQFIEIGKAFRSKDVHGEYAKTVWDLKMVFELMANEKSAVRNKTLIFIHSDAIGVRLYQKFYGAKAVERVDLVGDVSRIVSPQTPLPQNFLQSEYLLVSDVESATDHILLSFEKDASRKKLLEESPVIQRMYRKVKNLRDALDHDATHYEKWDVDHSILFQDILHTLRNGK